MENMNAALVRLHVLADDEKCTEYIHSRGEARNRRELGKNLDECLAAGQQVLCYVQVCHGTVAGKSVVDWSVDGYSCSLYNLYMPRRCNKSTTRPVMEERQ
jgi:hypothetical protein